MEPNVGLTSPDPGYDFGAPQAPAVVSQPAVPEDSPVQISVPGSDTIISTQAAAARAAKFSIGLPNSAIDGTKAFNMILDQREQDLREQASAEVDFHKTVQVNQAVHDIIAKQTQENGGQPLPLPQQMMIRDLVNRKATNPNTVIEENYADKFTERLKKTAEDNPTGALAEAFKSLPTYSQALLQSTKDLKAKYERVQTAVEEAQAALEKQSTTGYVVDILKNFTSAYQEAKLRGLVKGGITTTFGGHLAENIEGQWQDLLYKPFDEFDAQFTPIYKKMIEDNPALALFWLSAAHGFSTEDRVLTNMAPIMDVSLLGDVAAGGLKTAMALRLRGIANRASQTLIDHAEASVSKAAVAEAAGDLRGAAVEQFSNEVLKGPSEKQVTNTLNDIAGIFETKTNVLNDMGVPEVNGNMRQEYVNRLREGRAKLGNSLMDRVEHVMKLEQIPAVAAVPKVAARLAEDLVAEYPGLSNNIVKNNLVRDTTSGQWFYEATIAGPRGAFSSERVAQDFIRKTNLGEAKILAVQGPRLEKVNAAKVATDLSPEEAKEIANFAEGAKFIFDDLNPLPEISVKQQGAGFYVVKTKPVPLHLNYVRDLLLETKATRTPNSILNAAGGLVSSPKGGGIVGSLRTPEETLAVENMINRKLAVYSANKYYEIFKDTFKDINKLAGWKLPFTKRRAVWKEWNQFMTTLDNVANPATGNKGIVEAFDTPGELRDLFVQYKGRPPSEAEVGASFAYQNQELVRQQIVKLVELKNLYREGAQRWTLQGLEDFASVKGKVAGVAKEVQLNATRELELPTSDDATVLFLHKGKDGLDWQSIYDKDSLRSGARLVGSKLKETVDPDIASGKLKVLRLSNPDSKPLKALYNTAHLIDGHSVADLRITHAVVEAATDQLLSLDHVQVNPLPKHDYNHYVVQPHIEYNPVTKKYEYLGDRTIAGFNVRSMAVQMAEGLDTIREHLKNNNASAAKAYHAASHLPLNYEDIEQWFRPALAMEGWDEPSRLNLDHNIRVVNHGSLSVDLDKELERRFEKVKEETGRGFVDRSKEYFGDRKLHDPYDIFTANNTGTKENPLWNVGETKYVDPILSINRGLIKAINDINLNDYKATSVEHWLQEAKDLLDYRDSQIAAAPHWVFHHPEWKGGLSPTDQLRVQNLMTSQMQIRQFLGIKDVNTTFVHNVAQQLADSIYDRLGQGRVLLALESTLPFLKDPFEYARAMTFHSKVGLFAIPQLFLQMSTFAAIGGIAGWNKAAQGTHAMLLHTWSRINRNPEIIDFFDKKATAYGFKVGQFKEAFNILDSTGFANPGREHIWRDNTSSLDFIRGPWGTFLDWGQWPYQEGERASRTGAWYTAYMEFRDKNPTRKITDTDKRWILNRADLLNQNMSSASASGVQKGIWSLPTQFLSFPIRQAELMLNFSSTARLTPMEKGRLLGTYALLYGIPTTLGAFTLGVGGDLFKSRLASGGYVSTNPKNGPMDLIATQGLPSYLAYHMTGNMYNIGERYAGGSSPIIDAFRADKTLWDILGGASGSTVYKSIAGLDGIATSTFAAMKGVDKFRFKPEDFIEPLKQISSVNAVDRLYTAIQIGKWLSTSEQDMGKVSGMDAAFMTLLGLSKQSASDLGPVMWNKEYEKHQQAKALQTFIKEYRRGLREFGADTPNTAQGHDYLMRAYRELILKGYPKEDWPKAVALAISGQDSLPQRVMLDYYTKHIPEQEKDKRYEAMRAFLKGQQ